MTKSAKIADEIRDKILHTKELKANQMLATEQDLCKEYTVSKMTIKKALDVLVLEGLIYKKRGVGTFVKNLSETPLKNIIFSNDEQHLTGFSYSHRNENVSTKVIEYTIIPADTFLAEKLNIATGDFVYRILRVRFVDSSPIVHEETYMPIDIIPKLKKCHVENSIYSYIEATTAKKIQSAHICIRAAKCPETLASHLKLKKGEPIIQVVQIAFLDDGQIFEYSITNHRYDCYEFHNVVVRKP